MPGLFIRKHTSNVFSVFRISKQISCFSLSLAVWSLSPCGYLSPRILFPCFFFFSLRFFMWSESSLVLPRVRIFDCLSVWLSSLRGVSSFVSHNRQGYVLIPRGSRVKGLRICNRREQETLLPAYLVHSLTSEAESHLPSTYTGPGDFGGGKGGGGCFCVYIFGLRLDFATSHRGAGDPYFPYMSVCDKKMTVMKNILCVNVPGRHASVIRILSLLWGVLRQLFRTCNTRSNGEWRLCGCMDVWVCGCGLWSLYTVIVLKQVKTLPVFQIA